MACQNVSSEAEGAFTGEVSAIQARDAGCRYAIVGHSERRRVFGEDGAVLAKKLQRCREAGLTPIYCLGETLAERDAGQAADDLARQVETLAADPRELPLVVAYEPVWAIGTGRAARPEDAESARAHLAGLLADREEPADPLRGLRDARERPGALRADGRGRVPGRRGEPVPGGFRGDRPRLTPPLPARRLPALFVEALCFTPPWSSSTSSSASF